MAALKLVFPPRVEFYQEAISKDWRWQIKAINGKIIGASTEGYKNRVDCEANLIAVGKAASGYKMS